MESLSIIDSKIKSLEQEDITIKYDLKNNSNKIEIIWENQQRIEQAKAKIDEIYSSYNMLKYKFDISNKNENDKLWLEVNKTKDLLQNIVKDKELITILELERSLKDQTKKIDDLKKEINEIELKIKKNMKIKSRI